MRHIRQSLLTDACGVLEMNVMKARMMAFNSTRSQVHDTASLIFDRVMARRNIEMLSLLGPSIYLSICLCMGHFRFRFRRSFAKRLSLVAAMHLWADVLVGWLFVLWLICFVFRPKDIVLVRFLHADRLPNRCRRADNGSSARVLQKRR